MKTKFQWAILLTLSIQCVGVWAQQAGLPGVDESVEKSPSLGNQSKQISEGATFFYRISKSEPTRIVVQGSRIKRARAIEADLSIDKDDDVGQIYVTPVNTSKSSTLFVTTNSGVTFSLLLQPIDNVVGKTLLFTEKLERRVEQPVAGQPTPSTSGSLGNYEQSITTLLTAAGTGRLPAGIEQTIVNAPVGLWKNVRFLNTRVLIGPSMSLDEYSLTNTGLTELRMVEGEFFKPGVVSAAVEQHVLLPGETTSVYIVRQNQQNQD